MISETYDTVFVHIPKTAGQSIERVFLSKHGLTWDERAPLLLRLNEDRNAGPRRLAHLFAHEYVACGHVSPETFARMFRFAVVRNPYDRFMSEYRYRAKPGRAAINAMLEQIDGDKYLDEVRHVLPQVEFVRDRDGMVRVPQILRFETLATDIRPVFERLFGGDTPLPEVNKSLPLSDEADMLTPDLRRELYRRYEEDFDTFGYASGFVR